MVTIDGARATVRALRCKEHAINGTKKSALLAGASTVSVAALIVVKMLALNWAGEKLQSRFGRH